MNKLIYLSPVLALSVALGACSSGGGSSAANSEDSAANGGEEETRNFRVEGPLDAAQDPVSEEVFGALIEGSAGTELEPVAQCADQAVTFGALDIGDAVLVSLEAGAESMDPQSALTNGADSIQAAANQFAFDLQALLAAFTDGECNSGPASGNGGAPSFPEGNPFEGTPLAPLGEALAPVLEQFPADEDGGNGQPANLAELSDFFTALNQAFQDGLSQVPPEAMEAPVVGGILESLGVTLNDLDALILAVSIFDEAGATEATQTLVENTLVNTLTEIVPVNFFEEQAGMQGEFSDQIRDGAAQIADGLGELEALFDPLFNELLGDALQPLIDPIGNEVLPTVLGPITEAIASGGLPDGGDGGAGPTGTPLDAVISTLTEAFEGGGGSGGPTGTPLDEVIATLEGAFGASGEFDLGAVEDALAPLLGNLQ